MSRFYLDILISVFALLILFKNIDGKKDSSRSLFLYLSDSDDNLCTTDSPETFYRYVAEPQLELILEEGKVLFAILMDHFESSFKDDEIEIDEEEREDEDKIGRNESILEEWSNLFEMINHSFEMAKFKINSSWEKMIEDYYSQPLPWEIKFKKQLILQDLLDIFQEYKMLEAVIKTGVKELVGTMKSYIIETVQKVEAKIREFPNEERGAKSEIDLLNKMDKLVREVEPNFIGKIVQHLFLRVKYKIEKKNEFELKDVKWFYEPLEELALMEETFRSQSEKYPKFWKEITHIFKKTNYINTFTKMDIVKKYKEDEHLLLKYVVALLTN